MKKTKKIILWWLISVSLFAWIAYASNIITWFWETVATDDIISHEWYNAVNSFIWGGVYDDWWTCTYSSASW